MQGLDVYNSKQVRDKQIARIVGKVWLFCSLYFIPLTVLSP